MANLIPPGKLLGLRNSKTPLCVLKSTQMTSTKLHQKSVKSGLRPPCLNRRTGGSGHAQCSIEGTASAPPRYDAKPARFAANQGSRKLCSGGVTCSGLIRCAGLEQSYFDEVGSKMNMAALPGIDGDQQNVRVSTIKLKSQDGSTNYDVQD